MWIAFAVGANCQCIYIDTTSGDCQYEKSELSRPTWMDDHLNEYKNHFTGYNPFSAVDFLGFRLKPCKNLFANIPLQQKLTYSKGHKGW